MVAFELAYDYEDEIGDYLILPDKKTGEIMKFIPDNHLKLIDQAMLTFAEAINID